MNTMMKYLMLSTCAIALTFAAIGLSPVSGQNGGSALANHNTNAPIQWEADRAEVQDRTGQVILSGNVVARQEALRVTANRATATYSRGDGIDVSRIVATGGVIVSTPTESAESQTAIYDLDARIITMLGGVSLRRVDGNATGGRLTLDLRSGRAIMDGGVPGATGTASPATGRVTGTFSVPDRN